MIVYWTTFDFTCNGCYETITLSSNSGFEPQTLMQAVHTMENKHWYIPWIEKRGFEECYCPKCRKGKDGK